MLKINNLKVKYGDLLALDIDQELYIEDADKIGIIGSNGAGKSTLIKAILDLVNYSGNISFRDSKDNISVHMQDNNYSENVNVAEIIELVTGSDWKSDDKLKELIEFFSFQDSLKKKFKHLSGGQKQRLTLILVLYQETSLVLFDEVTSGLDYETRQDLVELLMRWYEDKGTTICYVTHYYEELELLADKILLLDHGKLICFGDKVELFEKYCGYNAFIINTQNYIPELDVFKKLYSPEHITAFRADNEEEATVISQVLIEKNINFKKTNNDIELMSFNAIRQYKQNNGSLNYEK